MNLKIFNDKDNKLKYECKHDDPDSFVITIGFIDGNIAYKLSPAINATEYLMYTYMSTDEKENILILQLLDSAAKFLNEWHSIGTKDETAIIEMHDNGVTVSVYLKEIERNGK